MALIACQNVTKSYGQRHVLRGVSVQVSEGDRIGLIGPNGEGKTTLLKLLGRLDEPTEGLVDHKRGLRIGYLPQDPPTVEGGTLYETVAAALDDLRAVGAEMEELAGRLADASDEADVLQRYAALQHDFEVRGGYTVDVKIKTVLTGLGFPPDDWARPLSEFSGGQQTRAMLGRLLLDEPDVLLLDEPTNHLDMHAVEWLERYLTGFRNAIVVVSHDRYFLDRIAQWTWEVAFGSVESYRGNYTAHLAQRRDRFVERTRLWEAQQEHIQKTEEFIRRHHAASRAKEARGRRTRLERFLRDEAIEKPREHKTIHLRLRPSGRTGEIVFKTRDLAVGYEQGKPVVTVGDLQVVRGQRIAVIGGNGTGKTTLLRTLLGDLPPIAGETRPGARVVPGYLPQSHDALDPARTALQVLCDASPGLLADRARTVLGAFLFSDDDVFKKVGDLSGGERSRVILAILAVRNASVLLLDEPTNHLDIPSQEILQEALAEFDGPVLFVSHDRYLIDALATHVWLIEDGGLREIIGDWEAYLRWRSGKGDDEPAEAPAVDDPKDQRLQQRAKVKLAHRQRQRMQRRQQRLEDEIHALEFHLEKLSEGISTASMAQELDEVHALGADYQKAEAELKALWDEWAEVSEALEG